MATPDRLTTYRRKRDFGATPEPRGDRARKSNGTAAFVVHLHHARARHFDLRLQLGDVLRSWAVPKGPSLDPRNKRLAVQVEDHPLDYGDFEGQIPEGQYGAGEVWVWDRGTWSAQGDARRALDEGHLRFTLDGERLHGGWSLIRTRGSARKPQWLLIKSHDAAERAGDQADDTPLSRWKTRARRTSPRLAGRRPTSDPPAVRPARKKRGAGSPLPVHLGLQLARLVDQAPPGADWLHEVKFDGYRVLMWRDAAGVRISSRGDQDWTGKLPATARAVTRLACRSCVLDGELVALDSAGRSSFGRLQQLFGEPDRERQLRVMVFDLLYLDGEDLRALPQIERKKTLAQLLKGAQAPLEATTFTTGNGPAAARAACAQGLEGIVCKLANAPYQEGRGGSWVKVKCVQSDEYAIVGYTTGKGARATLGSLLLGSPTDAAWRYWGRVGTGLNERMIADLLGRLQKVREPVRFENPPARAQLRGARPVWVRPELVVEVEFRGLTEEGLLRQASVKGARLDRSAASLRPGARDAAQVGAHAPAAPPEATRAPAVARAGRSESPSAKRKSRAGKRDTVARAQQVQGSVADVRLTHPERVLFRDPPITKSELAQFYQGIAEFILPGLINRPLMLLRCPDGADGECFFQKHLVRGFPAAVHEVNDRASRQRWIYVDSLAGLIALVQMNALEYHAWQATIADLNRSDRIVFDLDPAGDVPWTDVIQGAIELRARLARMNLQSFVRTSGGKGLHVVLPVRPAADWDEARGFARSVAESIARDQPQRYLAVAAKTERRGKIYIDYLRNGRGSTAICSYSLRNRPGAPVATPLSWEELPRVRAPDQFRFDNIGRRLARGSADPWSGLERVTQTLPQTGS
jgi:bifunctional non-homologous end joining protein LigD